MGSVLSVRAANNVVMLPQPSSSSQRWRVSPEPAPNVLRQPVTNELLLLLGADAEPLPSAADSAVLVEATSARSAPSAAPLAALARRYQVSSANAAPTVAPAGSSVAVAPRRAANPFAK